MTHLSKPLSIAIASYLLGACISKGDISEDDIASAPFILPTAADYRVPAASDYNIDLKLSNNLIDNKLMKLDPLPEVIFTVWGFDQMVADGSASKISVSKFPLRPQSVPYALRFSESELGSIEFQSGLPDAIRYYITFGVDVDGDGEFCNGDFRQNYSASPPERFPVDVSAVSRDVEVSLVSGEICGP